MKAEDMVLDKSVNDRNKEILFCALKYSSLSYAEIGKIFQISKQRVGYILKKEGYHRRKELMMKSKFEFTANATYTTTYNDEDTEDIIEGQKSLYNTDGTISWEEYKQKRKNANGL